MLPLSSKRSTAVSSLWDRGLGLRLFNNFFLCFNRRRFNLHNSPSLNCLHYSNRFFFSCCSRDCSHGLLCRRLLISIDYLGGCPSGCACFVFFFLFFFWFVQWCRRDVRWNGQAMGDKLKSFSCDCRFSLCFSSAYGWRVSEIVFSSLVTYGGVTHHNRVLHPVLSRLLWALHNKEKEKKIVQASFFFKKHSKRYFHLFLGLYIYKKEDKSQALRSHN